MDNSKISEKDIILLQRVCDLLQFWFKKTVSEKISWDNLMSLLPFSFFQGGTGYAAANDCLEGKHERPVLQA